MRTIVVGLGNPVLTDDAVGIHAARLLRQRVGEGVTVAEAYAGGLRLMEALVGYDRAFIVDAMWTGAHPPGTVREFGPETGCTRNVHSSHDGGLDGAIALGRMLGLDLPRDIRLVGVEALDVTTFGEELTDEVAAALPEVVACVLGGLR